MGSNEKSFTRRIVVKGIADAAGYVLGRMGVPFPSHLLEEAVILLKNGKIANFVDWELRDWPTIYYKELNSVIQLPYAGKKYLLPQVLIFNNVKHRLNLSQIYFKRKEELFQLPHGTRALTEAPFKELLQYLQKKKTYYNDENLRLVNITEKEGGVEFEVQPVNYEDYVHTNLVLDARPKKESQTLRESIHGNGGLEELNDSPLANNLGINHLLSTADGSLFVQKRSKKVAFRSGELCPSFSGTVSSKDVLKEITLEDIPKLREGFEEIGLLPGDVPPNEIFFLGITRELIRGGEPEMFLFAKTNLSEKEVLSRRKHARDRWESKKLFFFPFGTVAFEKLSSTIELCGFLRKVDEFIDKYIEKSGVTLLTNLALWVQHRLEQNMP